MTQDEELKHLREEKAPSAAPQPAPSEPVASVCPLGIEPQHSDFCSAGTCDI
jgi:hypothetical protein